MEGADTSDVDDEVEADGAGDGEGDGDGAGGVEVAIGWLLVRWREEAGVGAGLRVGIAASGLDVEKRMSCSAYRCISAVEMTSRKSLRRRNWSSSSLSSVSGRPPT